MLLSMFPLSNPVQSILYALITKSVGSGFRVWEDSRYRPAQLSATLKREAVLLGLTTVVTTGVQVLFTKVLSSTLQKKPGLSQHELLLRALVTAPALIFAEWVSRELAPKMEKQSSGLSSEHEFWNGRSFASPSTKSLTVPALSALSGSGVFRQPDNFQGGVSLIESSAIGKRPLRTAMRAPQSFQSLGFYGFRV